MYKRQALDGKIRVSVVATGMDEAVMSSIEPMAPARRAAPAAPTYAPTPAPAKSWTDTRSVESLRVEPSPAPEPTPIPEPEPVAMIAPEPEPIPAPEPAFEPVIRDHAPAEPVIHAAREDRVIGRIVDPAVEEYESRSAARAPARDDQGDLYFDRGRRDYGQGDMDADQGEPETKKGGWSLFGRGKRPAPLPSPYPAPQQTRQELRPTQSAQPRIDPEAAEDDLEIPSFLRRLAN